MDAEHTILRQAQDRPSTGSGQAAELRYAPRMSLTRRDALKLGALGPLALAAKPRALGRGFVSRRIDDPLRCEHLLVLAFRAGQIPRRESHRAGGRHRVRRRRDPARADGQRDAGLREPIEAGGLPAWPRPADALDPSGLRVAEARRAPAGGRSHEEVHRAGRAARHSRHPPQLRPLEHHRVLRRPDEGQGQRAADPGLHGRRRLQVVHRLASTPVSPTPRPTASSSRWRTTGA